MKITLLIATLSLSFLGCKRCFDCEATDISTNQLIDEETVCGQSEADDYESVWTDAETDGYCYEI